MIMEKSLYPSHPVCCIITGPSECGKSYFLTNLSLNIIIEYEKIYIYSPGWNQKFYQKILKRSSNYITIHMIPNNLNGEIIDALIEEILTNKDLLKSDTKIETYESL